MLQDESNKLCPDEFIGMRPIPGICTKFVECFKVIIMLMMITRGMSVNDSVPACCRVGVEFESSPHCVILETCATNSENSGNALVHKEAQL